MTPSEKLKKLRIDRGLTQKQLAELANIPLKTLLEYEQNRRQLVNARAGIVIKLADALDIHPRDLIDNI